HFAKTRTTASVVIESGIVDSGIVDSGIADSNIVESASPRDANNFLGGRDLVPFFALGTLGRVTSCTLSSALLGPATSPNRSLRGTFLSAAMTSSANEDERRSIVSLSLVMHATYSVGGY